VIPTLKDSLKAKDDLNAVCKEELKTSEAVIQEKDAELEKKTKELERKTKQGAILESQYQALSKHVRVNMPDGKLPDGTHAKFNQDGSVTVDESNQPIGDSDASYQAHMARNLKKKLTCSTCNEREKEVILPCMHMFCHQCVQDLIKTRKRACPIDRTKFSDNGVQKIYWNE
jgi:E3 ubiquitin-protein ligase BRE1